MMKDIRIKKQIMKDWLMTPDEYNNNNKYIAGSFYFQRVKLYLALQDLKHELKKIWLVKSFYKLLNKLSKK